MRNECYNIEIGKASMTFEFVSEGPKGLIRKRVEYRKVKRRNVYILSFGDIDAATNDIDDEIISNNGDGLKVLATVVSTVYFFTEKYPTAIVYAEGSNAARTRLYRIGISNNLEELKEKFDVYGFLAPIGWSEFEKNTNYSSFFVTRKKMSK